MTEYDPAGNQKGTFTPTAKLNNGTTYELTPYQICLDPQGRIYIFVQLVDQVNSGVINTVYRYDDITGSAATLKSVTLPFQVPVGMASDGTYFYVTDGGRIFRINADLSGQWSAPYGSNGNNANQFNTGGAFGGTGSGNHGLALDPSGTHLYVADYNNARLVQITTAGFNSLPSTAPFNFTAVPLTNSGTNGAKYFKPVSVAIDGANSHVVFTGIEVQDNTKPDIGPPYGTNVVNSFVQRIDVSGVATHQAANRTSYGGAFTSTGAAGEFGKPNAVGAK